MTERPLGAEDTVIRLLSSVMQMQSLPIKSRTFAPEKISINIKKVYGNKKVSPNIGRCTYGNRHQREDADSLLQLYIQCPHHRDRSAVADWSGYGQDRTVRGGAGFAANNYAIGSALISAIRNNPDDAASYPGIKPV